jgi:hypothetical protein
MAVLRQALADQRKPVGHHGSSKLDEQSFPTIGEDLYFQLDHKAPLLLDAGDFVVSRQDERFRKIKA